MVGGVGRAKPNWYPVVPVEDARSYDLMLLAYRWGIVAGRSGSNVSLRAILVMVQLQP